MKFNFDEVISRRGSNSYKWDSVAQDVLPMWVADMDFKVAPAIIDALRKRVEHGIFGYTKVPQSYYQAIIDWFSRRHEWNIQQDWIIYTTGVVPALSAIIKALTVPGDKVLIQSPVYNCFFSSIRNNGCEIEDCPLDYVDGRYELNPGRLERHASDPAVKLMVLCNPHNPAGRVWTRSELEQIAVICERNNVFVVSDEIHCEFTHGGHVYTPFATLAPHNFVTCISPSKSFNMAGLQMANIVAVDADIRAKINKAINVNEVCDLNVFAVEALQAAYNHGEEWLMALNEYIYRNYQTVIQIMNEKCPQFTILPLEGTYLVWIDCGVLPYTSVELSELLLQKGRIYVNDGVMYGTSDHSFIRLNIACPHSVLLEGLERLCRTLQELVSITK